MSTVNNHRINHGAVSDGSTAHIEGNVIEGASVAGQTVERGTSPTVNGHTICGSPRNLDGRVGAEPVLGDDEIFGDAAGWRTHPQ